MLPCRDRQVQGNGVDAERRLADLAGFRKQVYGCLRRRADHRPAKQESAAHGDDPRSHTAGLSPSRERISSQQYNNGPDDQRFRLALREVARSGMPWFDQRLRPVRIEEATSIHCYTTGPASIMGV